jgi:7,8-dihydroneopterin aldolase/epimerase/oxygenase
LDIITLKSLKFHARHGYYESERSGGNHFEIDVIAKGDFKRSIEGDNLENTFNYELVSQLVADVMFGESEKLIEALCNKIGEQIFEVSKNVKKLKVSVRKMNPPIKTESEYAEITMKWKR